MSSEKSEAATRVSKATRPWTLAPKASTNPTFVCSHNLQSKSKILCPSVLKKRVTVTVTVVTNCPNGLSSSTANPSSHAATSSLRMYMKSIALFVAIYGRTALAALPASCEDTNNCSNACTRLNSEFEPPGVGEVWFSHCCTVSDTNTEDPPVTESKKYCFSYYLTGYPNNQFYPTKPICSETGSSTLAWLRKGQCGTSSGPSLWRGEAFGISKALPSNDVIRQM
eukprot:scaffold4024_cov208-Skeletonema_marinoi.AAC.9